jgi:hypothetical protein
MRRLQLVMILAILLQACSLNEIFLPPAAAPAPTITPFITLTPIDTATPSITPTLTPSPTIVRFPTQDPDQVTATVVVIPLFIGSVTATPFAFPGSSRPGQGFTSVTVSENRIYWGGCKYNSTVINAKVDDPQGVISVVIFTRVKSADKEDYTPWTTGNVMFKHRDGTFTYLMRGSDVEGHNHYKKSWVLFQLVATDIRGEEVGRTGVYTDSIQMSPCMCLDPSTGCPPTPIKVPKP